MALSVKACGKPRCHDVEREKSLLVELSKDYWRCSFQNCGITIKNLRNARRHVRVHLANSVIDDEPPGFSQSEASLLHDDILFSYDNDGTQSDIFVDDVDLGGIFKPVATSSVIDVMSVMEKSATPDVTSTKEIIAASSADLFNAVKLQHDVPDRAALKFLHLMKLPGFKPAEIKEADVKRDSALSAVMTSKWRCKTCWEEITNGPCSNDW